MREKNIFNVFVAVCIALGFACFAFILLPEKLQEAKITAPVPNVPRHLPLSAIADIDKGRAAPAIPESAAAVRVTPPPSTAPEEEALATTPAQADIGGDEAAFPAHGVDLKVHPVSSIAGGEHSTLDSPKGRKNKGWIFPPEGLETDVAFWRDIYSKYGKDETVLHHPRNLGIIYEVVDTSSIVSSPDLSDLEKGHLIEKRIEERREAVTEALLKLASNPKAETLTDEEWRIRKLFPGGAGPDAFRRAANEFFVRAQVGQRDKFIAGLKVSGRYMGEIERIFAEHGLPRELTRIVFVESMFDTNAKSLAGASGIWQFMPATGRLYLKMNRLVDERDDPIAATHAAAKLLRQNYDELGSWELAVNAYNTGRGRMAQAVKLLGTMDIGAIIKNFNHPSYAFASRNFYLEFLAALDVAEHAGRYFAGLKFDAPLRYDSVTANRRFSLPEVARLSGIGMETVEELNPHLLPPLLEGKEPVPAGLSVRVPEGKGSVFAGLATRAPEGQGVPVKHVVAAGESLTSIAEMYGVSVGSLRESNHGIAFFPPKGHVVVVP